MSTTDTVKTIAKAMWLEVDGPRRPTVLSPEEFEALLNDAIKMPSDRIALEGWDIVQPTLAPRIIALIRVERAKR